MARQLDVNIDALQQLIGITGISPFGSFTETADTLNFIDKVRFIKSSDFTLSELNSLLKVNSDNAVDNVKSIAEVLTAVRDGLQEIKLQFSNDDNDKETAQIDFIADSLSTAFDSESTIISVMLNGLVKFTAANTESSLFPFIGDAFIESQGPVFSVDDNDEIEWLFPDLFETYKVLSKTWDRIALLIAKLSISTTEFVYFQENETALNLTGIWNLPKDSNAISDGFRAIENLIYLVKFRNTLPQSCQDWVLLLDPVIQNINDPKNSFIISFAEYIQESRDNLESLIDPDPERESLSLTFPDDYLKGKHLLNVMQCINKAKDLGSTTLTLCQLTNDDPQDKEAQLAKGIIKSKYDETSWLDVIKPISNELREKKRDALVSYILNSTETEEFRNEHNILNSNALFEYFLIDTEMAACMMTSRIKQAISTVQLFIDRNLMGLETGIALGADFAEQWHKWRKQYRIWEANRKVFLYPENWIEPELRDDKTPFFKELESKLTQNEITDDIARDALIEYLEKLDTVANLEVIGLFPDQLTGIDHVIGRTKNIPHQYFYRNKEKSLWSAWEKIELDIEGDHILPVVWNNRLILFWGVFTEKQRENDEGFPLKQNLSSGKIESTKPTKYLEMKLNWSEYKNGRWGSKKISDKFLEIYPDILAIIGISAENKKQLFLSSRLSGGALSIRLFASLCDMTDESYRFLTMKINDNDMNDIGGISHFKDDMFDILLDDLRRGVGGGGGSGGGNGGKDDNNCEEVDSDNMLQHLGLGEFNFTNCNNSPSISYEVKPVEKYPFLNVMKLKRSTLNYPFLIENVSNNDKVFSIYSSGLFKYKYINEEQSVKIFDSIPEDHQLLTSYHEIEKKKTVKFFYNNERSIFYVHSIKRFIRDNSIDRLDGTLVMDRKSIDPGSAGLFNRESISEIKADGSLVFPDEGKSSPRSRLKKTFYKFDTFYHPYICDYIEVLNTVGIDALYEENIQKESGPRLFKDEYMPTHNVIGSYPKEDVDFSFSGAYSIYNWELFFHIPLLIATRLSQNQKFEEARKWFHYIFAPTKSVQPDDAGAERFWITKPFKEEIQSNILSIEELINGAGNLDVQLQYWEANPFNPHAVARKRFSAYMRTTVMKYIDNLIEWGDQLFRRDTIESVNEATLLYVLAGNLLGEKPANIPARAEPEEHSFSSLQEDRLDGFSNAKVLVQSFLSHSGFDDEESFDAPLHMPLFCFPKNNKLLGYWDTVADRLFKVRNCMNIEGVVRQLPLFQLPIDPALLVRATAQGLDLNDILNNMQAPLPHYRFQVMLQKANELCNDVKTLGSQLLSVLEKRDAEGLSLLRSGQEMKLLDMVRDIKVKQRDEAKENLKSTIESKRVIAERKNYYEGRAFINTGEAFQLQSANFGLLFQLAQSEAQLAAGIAYSGPDFKVGGPFTVGSYYGGTNIGNASSSAASKLATIASINNWAGSLAGTLGSYNRRMDDWEFQAKTADLELKQIDNQITAAEIRLDIAEKDLNNHDLQIENSKATDEYLCSKFTNQELYEWMIGQVRSVYFQSYQLAHDFAKKAEKAYRFELGSEDTFISYGYWDSMKKGLLAGEHLYYDLKRMESVYFETNKREYELTKHISLLQLNPATLIQLRESGFCEIDIPEVLFDLDYPGHLLRRIKAVSLSIPCVTGPYTSVNCTLTLLANRIRVKTDRPDEDYSGSEDGRFITKTGGDQSIATSTARDDSGLFEFNFRDERYLPFEGAGVVSSWRLELPSANQQFDYATISDVILHMRYTARSGGDVFKDKIGAQIDIAVNQMVESVNKKGIFQFLSMKHEFGTDFHKFLNPDGTDDHKMNISLSKQHFPFLFRQKKIEIQKNVIVTVKLRDISLLDNNGFALTITHNNGTERGELKDSSSNELSGLANNQYTQLNGDVTQAGNWVFTMTNTDVENLPEALRKTVLIKGDSIQRIKADEVEDIGVLLQYKIS